jgi:hypothetical protein
LGKRIHVTPHGLGLPWRQNGDNRERSRGLGEAGSWPRQRGSSDQRHEFAPPDLIAERSSHADTFRFAAGTKQGLI